MFFFALFSTVLLFTLNRMTRRYLEVFFGVLKISLKWIRLAETCFSLFKSCLTIFYQREQ